MQQFNDAGRAIIVNWTYSKEEWSKFSRVRSLEKGLLSYVLHRLKHVRSTKPPRIMITDESVFINEQNEIFNSPGCFLKRINIIERNNINIMEINYSIPGNAIREIRIPVPRGKLKEAVELEERLLLIVKL
jgi:hypothetical protein